MLSVDRRVWLVSYCVCSSLYGTSLTHRIRRLLWYKAVSPDYRWPDTIVDSFLQTGQAWLPSRKILSQSLAALEEGGWLNILAALRILAPALVDVYVLSAPRSPSLTTSAQDLPSEKIRLSS